MKASHTTAVWMVEYLGLDAGLSGDLLEEYAHARSTIWYWRQVLIAVWFSIWNTIFDNKVLALRALATGCAVNAGWLFLWRKFLHFGITERPLLSIELATYLSILLLTQAVTGWIISRTHRSHAIPMVFVLVVWLVLWYVEGTLSAGRRLLTTSITPMQFGAHLAWYLAPIVTEVAGLLFGGILGARPRRQPSNPTNTAIH